MTDTLSRGRIVAFFFAAALCVLPGESHAQCMLANPSFEIPGSGGAAFGGWNQFGIIGSSAEAEHGSAAARVTGPNLGGWDLSALWQKLDASPGDEWSASITAWHTTTRPLAGDSRAILNVEWRDTGGSLISYESHTVLDAFTPPGAPQSFQVTTSPAPVGTASTHFLFGTLQGPTDPQPDVYCDLALFETAVPATAENNQWNDFPGGRTLLFSGRTWRVKGPGFYGPGGSFFCDSPACTWVDGADDLHMTIRNVGGTWQSTEVTLEEVLGYGDYIFTTRGRLDDFDPEVVLGLFLWEYGACFDPANGWWGPYNEIDIEFSKWTDPSNPNAGQFVAQPYDWPGNLHGFDHTFTANEITSHAFRWLPDRVEFRSWVGGPLEESPGTMIAEWTYTGPHIPRPGRARVHINLWQIDNIPPSAFTESVIEEFTFLPHGVAVAIPSADLSGPDPLGAEPILSATPNPFRSETRISYQVSEAGPVQVDVYTITGRRVRSLVNRSLPVGARAVVWDGRDDRGQEVAPAIYLLRIQTTRALETRRLVVLK